MKSTEKFVDFALYATTLVIGVSISVACVAGAVAIVRSVVAAW